MTPEVATKRVPSDAPESGVGVETTSGTPPTPVPTLRLPFSRKLELLNVTASVSANVVPAP
jgi:hypothetical protein